uniref:Multidrug and toxin extrusion protein n=1 Tax=Gouania willdenowi TaxID=441366 RepID=A0A8C5DD51_GOUWI
MEKLGSLEPAHHTPGVGPVAGDPVAKTAAAAAAAGPVGEETPTVESSKLFRCACVKRWIPLAYREEIYHVLRLTGPLLLSRILNFLLPFVNSIFCGHIGNAALAGYALASATISVTTMSTGFGFIVACDTLISQTYGGKNMKRVGVIIQRSMLILLLYCLPCWALLINSHSLLLLMHQEAQVAEIAQLYVMAYLPAVPGIILPQMYTAAATNIINVGINYVLIITLDWGVIGSAIASGLSRIILCILLFVYIKWKKLYKETWGGWSMDSLQDWGSIMKLAIPSVFMVCFEWWIWEIGGFLAGLLGELDLAAQHVLMEIGTIMYMFPLGVQAAACVRVGNALGAGNTPRAIITCKVTLLLVVMLAVVQGVVIACSKSILGRIFTSDVTIVDMVSHNLTVQIFLQFFDGLLCVCSGILVGSGMQKIAAVSNLVCYYCIGVPVGIALMFAAELRITGLWLGIFLSAFIESGFFVCLIFKVNWKKVTQKAEKRAGKKTLITPMRPASTVLNDGLPDVLYTAQLPEDESPTSEGYCAVGTQDQELKVMDGDSVTKAKRTEEDKITPEPLSTNQLMIRRGITFSVLALILAVGVTVYVTVPLPEPRSSANFTLNGTNGSTPATLALLNMTSNF